MNTRCPKCGENHRTGQCAIKEKIENPTCINCNNKGHMASSECPLYPKPQKGKSKSPQENKNRHETPQVNTSLIVPGLSFAQITSTKTQQQMVACGSDPSAFNSFKSNQKENIPSEKININQNQNSEFTFLQAIMEIKQIFDLFPTLLKEMERSYNTNNPEEKLTCLVRGICSSASSSTTQIKLHNFNFLYFSTGSMTYAADIFFAQSWKDHRLRLPENMSSEYRLLEVSWLQNIWRPDSFFKNAKAVTFQTMTIPNHYVWLYKDKTILYMVKLTLILSCAMNFAAYPHDTQHCSLEMESLSHTTDDLIFDWDESVPLVVSEDIELPQLDLMQTEKKDCTQHYSTGNFTCLKLTFTLKRRLGYYMFHTYIPTCLIVIMSWVSFWIRPEAVPARVTLGVTSLLTLSTQHAKSLDSLPPVSYIKAIDIFMATCTVFVFLSLMEFALVNVILEECVTMKLKQRITRKKFEESLKDVEVQNEVLAINMEKKSSAVSRQVKRRKIWALRIDQVSRVLFPLSFGGLTVAYWSFYVLFN
ncbi:glycine receptor subunit alpha-3 [Trichonephila clavata]|uniref:Glycine receptor subunit alpha-3 n=1 Tax=Trichonephila clavata TaxID=2740835 RepID=A0A8X6LK29_TRICU|nr:glycine receptor subunit alpha-3 [Trichonephila clavata]